MKSLQNILLFCLVFGLMGVTIYDRIARQSDRGQIEPEDRISLEMFNIDLPEELFFCGEPVPMREPDVRERLDVELHRNVFFHSNTYLIMKRANRWLPQIEAILQQYGLPDDLKYLAIIESGLTNVVSPAGATGFWQIMESTGKEFGMQIDKQVDERYDPIKSTHVAARYLKRAYNTLGSWSLAAAAYNRGIGGMEKALSNQQVNSFYDLNLNPETFKYLFRALAIKEIIENPGKYRYQLKPSQLYPDEPVRKVTVSQSIPNLVEFSLQQGINYKLLKRYNPWLRGESLQVPAGASFVLQIPTGHEIMLEDSELAITEAVINPDSAIDLQGK